MSEERNYADYLLEKQRAGAPRLHIGNSAAHSMRSWQVRIEQAMKLGANEWSCLMYRPCRVAREWLERMESTRPVLVAQMLECLAFVDACENNVAYDDAVGSLYDRVKSIADILSEEEKQFQPWSDSVVKSLRQNMRLLADEMNDRSGQVPIADFAELAGWIAPYDNSVSSLISRFNKRMESLGYPRRIHQRDNCFVQKT